MEENVALDSKKQKKFVKSIRGIKKLIKKNEKIEAKSEPKKKDEQTKPEKPFSMRLKDGKVKKKHKKERGLVYLSHIPHGFYEHQMTQYFKQFGVVTNARVIKSKRTGNSKGHAFVEFKETSVAEIVAETMNNYLMGKRLIKAVYIPPEKQKRRAFRKHWSAVHNPTSVKRLELKKAFNEDKDADGDLKKATKLLATLNKTKKKLTALGINYDFFSPVDVPETLLDDIKKEVEHKDDKKVVKNVKQNNKANKNNKNDNKVIEGNKTQTKGKQEDKKNNKSVKVCDKQQKEKEKKLKNAGVKSVAEYISLDAEDSDESCGFDSDEYEKMLEDEHDDSSTGESEDSGDEAGDSEEEEPESDVDEVPVVKKTKGKPKVTQPVQQKKQTQKQQVKKQDTKAFTEVKRKAPQKSPVANKKPKFEKQNQKPLKKQFKKK